MQSVSSKPMHRELASQPYSPLITLMTVDYLLSARDLPGWGGSFPAIDYRQVLVQGLRELAHGLYGDDRICRELAILDQIARAHGLSEFFLKEVRRNRRKRQRDPFVGGGINASALFFDGERYELRNIVDAAYAAKYLHQAISDLKPNAILDLVVRSLRYRIAGLGKSRPFPPESQWRTEKTAPSSSG